MDITIGYIFPLFEGMGAVMRFSWFRPLFGTWFPSWIFVSAVYSLSPVLNLSSSFASEMTCY